jgi:hypothetical protein
MNEPLLDEGHIVKETELVYCSDELKVAKVRKYVWLRDCDGSHQATCKNCIAAAHFSIKSLIRRGPSGRLCRRSVAIPRFRLG